MNPKWSSRFELKPGKWVFVPTPESVVIGNKIKTSIESTWHPPSFYYHLRAGGHVAALKSHTHRKNFLRVDLQDFFGSIGLGRVTRRLTEMFGYDLGRSWAKASTVRYPADKTRHVLPFGFVQSPVIASLCLAKSALGKRLHEISRISDVDVSVYMDDIIISTDDEALCSNVLDSVRHSARVSAFTLNLSKQQGPVPLITAFNILLGHETLHVAESRMASFSNELEQATSDAQRAGIIAYVASVNAEQAAGLEAS